MNWRWVTKRAPIILHEESPSTHGGGSGIRDEGLLGSSLARPENLLAYVDAKNSQDISALGVWAAEKRPAKNGRFRGCLTPLATLK